jgi:hypothetical protein
MKVIGIDIAGSGKSSKTWICDGETVYSANPENLYRLLKIWKRCADVLICWDSPLSVNIEQENFHEKSFTTRKIESFLGKKLPDGITVSGYTGVSHWAISQFMLGYPHVGGQMGEVNKSNVPYSLIEDEQDKPSMGHFLVEVHPAVAMYHWLKKKHSKKKTCWAYKKSFKNREERQNAKKVISRIVLWQKMAALFSDPNISTDEVTRSLTKHGNGKLRKSISDGRLDAAVAWLLGKVWLVDEKKVKLLGNSTTGSMLLPYDKKLFEKFKISAEK